VGAAMMAGLLGFWWVAPLVGWDVAAVVLVGWIGASVLSLDGQATCRVASSEDPGRAVADALLLMASAASLVAVGFSLIQAGRATGTSQEALAGLGVLSVILSWTVVHTVFMLRYARLYYAEPRGGVDFNEDELPNYMDFAYLAFTIGMTFQVSDTDLTSKEFRAMALHHALWSYLFGTVIIAMTVNLIAGLSK
jgi:uncharacterized membrane protein